MPDLDTRFIEVCRPRGLPEAHVVRLRLEEAGIPVVVENELLQGVVGELPFGWPTSPRLMVPEEDLPAARDLLRDARAAGEGGASSRATDSTCLACGTDMDEAAVCPECGWSFREIDPPAAQSAPASEQLPCLWEIFFGQRGE